MLPSSLWAITWPPAVSPASLMSSRCSVVAKIYLWHVKPLPVSIRHHVCCILKKLSYARDSTHCYLKSKVGLVVSTFDSVDDPRDDVLTEQGRLR